MEKVLSKLAEMLRLSGAMEFSGVREEVLLEYRKALEIQRGTAFFKRIQPVRRDLR